MNAPAIERAVQTTPPIIIAAVMPSLPLRPTLTSTNELRISVMRVIPDTGFEPTMAIALAATVVNRNEMIKTITRATTDCIQLWSTPNWKNTNTVNNTAISTDRIVRMAMSR